MKILILYRHFWPDSPPYASMLRSIGHALVKAGHEVTIWTEEPCYKSSDRKHDTPSRELLDGIIVERFARLPDCVVTGPMQLLDKLLFVPRLLLKAMVRRLRGARYDLVWTATIPPVLQGWVGRMIAELFSAKFLYHCQDLYPELAVHMGLWRQGSLPCRLLTGIERRNRERADLLVTLSEDMLSTVRTLASPRCAVLINNFLLDDFSGDKADGAERSSVLSRPTSSGRPTMDLIFAGNMGKFQGLAEFLRGFLAVEKDAALRLTFMGDGKVTGELKQIAKFANATNVRFVGQMPFEKAKHIIGEHDIGIISLEPGVHRYAYPSKTLTYLGLGLPLLALVEADSDLGRMIDRERVGLVLPKRDEGAIAAALQRLSQSTTALAEMKMRATQVYAHAQSRETRLSQWLNAIDRL